MVYYIKAWFFLGFVLTIERDERLEITLSRLIGRWRYNLGRTSDSNGRPCIFYRYKAF